jgi:hypothetical protein
MAQAHSQSQSHSQLHSQSRSRWLELVRERVLSPRRLDLARCEGERGPYLEARRIKSEERTRAKIHCERRIDALRAEVFAAQDGVVTARMTALEREWRQLSRAAERDREGALMDLWARVAPREWIDRKRWRDTAPALQLDAVIALASDVDGVNNAEAAITTLIPKSRIRWRMSDEHDFEHTSDLLKSADPDRIDNQVYAAALERFPKRGTLARAIAHTAFVSNAVSNPGSNAGSSNERAHALHALWSTGYVISSIDGDNNVTLEIPPLERI